MGIHGEHVTRAAAMRAREALAGVAGEIAGWSTSIRRRDAPTLRFAEVPESTLRRGISRARDEIVWTNDNRCAPRAVFAAHLINREAGILAPADDAVAAGYAMALGPFRNTVAGNPFSWDFHVAPVVQLPGEATPSVVDFAMFREPVPLSTWENALGMPGGSARLHHPTGLPAPRLDAANRASHLQIAAAQLADTWDAAARVGRVDNPLLAERSIAWMSAEALSGRAARFARHQV